MEIKINFFLGRERFQRSGRILTDYLFLFGLVIVSHNPEPGHFMFYCISLQELDVDIGIAWLKVMFSLLHTLFRFYKSEYIL